jgi:hypothetical protein
LPSATRKAYLSAKQVFEGRASGEDVSDAQQKTAAQQPLLDKLKALLKRAQNGDADARARVKETLEWAPELWEYLGDLASHVQSAWIDLMAKESLQNEGYRRKVSEMKVQLASPNPSPREALLVDRVVSSWVQVECADATAAHTCEVPIPQAQFHMKRQTQAQKRYLSAVSALATFQRLMCTRSAAVESSAQPNSDEVQTAQSHGANEAADAVTETASMPTVDRSTFDSSAPPILPFAIGSNQGHRSEAR